MIAKGQSLHIGVNRVDACHYQYDGQLIGCENDANSMAEIAAANGFEDARLLGRQATADAVRTAILVAASKVGSNGTFLLTLACHGGQVPSPDGDEIFDEVIALYDRMLIDDELAELWTYFPQGSLIIVLADLCHSATIPELFELEMESARTLMARRDLVRALSAPARSAGVRVLPSTIPLITYMSHEKMYGAIQAQAAEVRERGTRATVISLSACRDDERARDGKHGLFTDALLEVNSEVPHLPWATLHAKIASRVTDVSSRQHPVLRINASGNRELLKARSFVI